MDPRDNPPQILQFGVFEVDLSQGELRKFGHRVKLQDRPFQLLAALLERPGQVVTREELVRKLWNDALVDFDNGLNIAAKKVREALDDDANTPRYVETLPRRGYRFIAPVQVRSAIVETPVPPAKSEPAAAPAPPPQASRRPLLYVRIGALIVVIFLAVRIYWLLTSVRPARLIRVVQLTQTGRVEVSEGVATDGSRVYFTQRDGGSWSLAQVSVEGGSPQPLPEEITNPDIMDISPDRTSLLVAGGGGVDPDRPLWVIPTVGGSPRRVGDLLARAGTWSRDGNNVVFSRGSALFEVNNDGTGQRKLLDLPGPVNSVRWAPPRDRDLLRFSVSENGGKPYALWEAAPNGTGLRRVLPDWNPATVPYEGDDSGVWAASGKYFLFRSLRGRVANIWAMREHRIFPRAPEGHPVPLYSTPMQFGALAPNPDGKRIFFAAGQERRELMRYSPARKQFLPFLPNVDARWAAFSKDEQWVAYSTVPDATLWRSREDGSERLQLTPPMLVAHQPRWSPDGSHIVFQGGPLGQAGRLYVILSTGGAPEPVTSDLFLDSDPSWSPDGHSLLFARRPPPQASGQLGLCLMDWHTRKTSFIPGSEALTRPAWSPDGRYIAATNGAGTEIRLLDAGTGKWSQLAAGEGLGVPFWTHDSKLVYYQEVLGGSEQPIFRVSLSSRKCEKIISSKQVQQPNAAGYLLVGLGPGDTPIASVIYDNSDIYALEVELP